MRHARTRTFAYIHTRWKDSVNRRRPRGDTRCRRWKQPDVELLFTGSSVMPRLTKKHVFIREFFRQPINQRYFDRDASSSLIFLLIYLSLFFFLSVSLSFCLCFSSYLSFHPPLESRVPSTTDSRIISSLSAESRRRWTRERGMKREDITKLINFDR